MLFEFLALRQAPPRSNERCTYTSPKLAGGKMQRAEEWPFFSCFTNIVVIWFGCVAGEREKNVKKTVLEGHAARN